MTKMEMVLDSVRIPSASAPHNKTRIPQEICRVLKHVMIFPVVDMKLILIPQLLRLTRLIVIPLALRMIDLLRRVMAVVMSQFTNCYGVPVFYY